MGKFAKSVLEINLDRISQNYKILKSYLRKAICGASIKTDAYGVGMMPVAGKLFAEGCNEFFVANLDEALECKKVLSNNNIYSLNRSCDYSLPKVVNNSVISLNYKEQKFSASGEDGFEKLQNEQVVSITEVIDSKIYSRNPNIYILHGVSCIEGAKAAAEIGLTPIISDLSQLEIWNNYGKKIGKKLAAVLHLETGMGRLALQKSDALKISKNSELISNVELTYIMSHLSCSDEINHVMNKEQLNEMREYQKMFKNIPVSFSNSGGIFLGEEYHYDLVRPGAALFGIHSCHKKQNPFLPVITLKAGILQKKILEKDQAIGYGATVSAKRGDKIITLECGYGDGYFRSLSNLGRGYYNNKELRQIGRVSMDMIIFNANSLTEEEFYEIDYVELLGDNITVNEVANCAGTIGYEVLTSLGSRYKKVYIG
ncbi:alanine racemase [Holosporaceae bacterium 'Namur']|nr:alanine racemase [Holosporaceae bacterium 'Namur']